MSEHVIEIDGSVLEGGGQILRIALSLSALLGNAIKITNIRKGRGKPGLMAQHLKGLQLVQQLTDANVTGAVIGSERIYFAPNRICGGTFSADTKTAGSIALLLQVALPCAYFANAHVKLVLRGGTNAEMAPQIDYMSEIFRPNLEQFGGTFDLILNRRGYFPKGGGEVIIDVNPIRDLKPITRTHQGVVTKIYGWSFVAGSLPIKLAHLMADSASQLFTQRCPGVEVLIERYKEGPQIAPDNCSGIILVCETDTGCILGGSALGKRNVTPEETGNVAAREILQALDDGACVDGYSQDQLIIFMAIAKGLSAIKVGEITLHTRTAIYVAELLTKTKFNIIPAGPSSNIIECQGIELYNT